jgi:ABC-type sulfate/molybdate transport systems ATPase subunit
LGAFCQISVELSNPRYLLLDEPSVGLAPQVTNRIFDAIEQLRDVGKGILLVEQNGRAALAISERAFLLEGGSIPLSGSGKELLENKEVVERYLGLGTSIGNSPLREVVDELHAGLVHVITSWEPYALAGIGYASMTLNQLALNTGALAATMATSTASDPIASVVLGWCCSTGRCTSPASGRSAPSAP